MALPLLFAACSQEELVSDNSNSPSLAGRKTVKNVVINLNEPETRMAFDGKDYTWETGNQFGACLMDEFNDINTLGTWWEDFTLKDYIQTNYPFTRQENGNWTSEAVMQEGNYFFYYPYNYNLGGKRTPIRIPVPTEQYVADDQATSAVLDNQLFVGYQPIVAEEGKESESLSLTLEPLLAFPGFNLKNVGTGSLTIQRVAFAADNVEWPTELLVKPASASFDNDGFADMETDDDRRDALKGIVSDGDEKVARITVTYGENGRELGSQEDMWVYIMVPEKSSLTNPKLYIYTNEGLGVANLDVAHKDAGSGDVYNITNDRALTDIVYNGNDWVYITFDNTSFGQPSDMPVSTTSDLENLVSWSQNSTQATLTANVSGDKVEISKAVYDMLNDNDKLVLNIECANAGDATVTIPADAPANALDRVNFKNVNIVNKANVTLSADLKRTVFGTTPTVGAPAKITNEAGITLSGNSFDLASTIVDNNGTITFKAADGKLMNVNMGNATQNQGHLNNTNKGTVVIATSVTVPNGGIVNNGALTINEDAALDGRIVNGENGEKDGVINVNGAWTTKFNSGVNYGTINVAATGSITVPSGTFTNNKNLVYSKQDPYALEFQAMINNSGVISGVTNNGTIVMKSASAQLSTATNSDGEIDNTEMSAYLAAQTGETVFCKVEGTVEATELGEMLTAAKATRLDINGEINLTAMNGQTEITDYTIPVAAVNAVGNLKLNAAGKTIRFAGADNTASLTVNAGTTEIAQNTRVILRSNTSGVKAGELTVEEGATLTIAGGATLISKDNAGAGTVNNYGTWTKETE